jgi:hypothetical protein
MSGAPGHRRHVRVRAAKKSHSCAAAEAPHAFLQHARLAHSGRRLRCASLRSAAPQAVWRAHRTFTRTVRTVGAASTSAIARSITPSALSWPTSSLCKRARDAAPLCRHTAPEAHPLAVSGGRARWQTAAASPRGSPASWRAPCSHCRSLSEKTDLRVCPPAPEARGQASELRGRVRVAEWSALAGTLQQTGPPLTSTKVTARRGTWLLTRARSRCPPPRTRRKLPCRAPRP